MFDRLFSMLDAVNPLSHELREHLKSILVARNIKRKEALLHQGQVCEYIYFVNDGLLRCYYEKHDSQITSWFMKENDVIISVKSFYTQTPSVENIVALENTTVLGIHYKDLHQIYVQFPEFNITGRILTTQYYIQSEERLYSLRKERAKDRYLSLLQTQPEILNRVPLKHVASYLGISLETLSRIRSER
ncbi:Crp/Fnr family transcriptional regulator [Niabella yanshanensis]|uniref:Crp/Fnr family transcriptional regulator n=1 Tax=Niabella yanshanensis TaxID=577386 RepID=A0ABZ0W3J2_9BACT|nr:Crp/Fnr family transcriptional regulator [Niabella yanshanensis]WQD37509.1 Crp/Fnr family transcriptional regulator [Niabella yanshanensis]